MAGNSVTLEFAGDATKLQRAAKQSTSAIDDVARASKDASGTMSTASQGASSYTDRVGKLGAAVDGASTALDDAGAAVQALADMQDAARAKAARLAQATNDMAQAQEDANQAMIDGKQATLDIGQAQIDAEQANIDAATAQKEYNEAVREHGRNSVEAQQASLDLKQAQQDLKQANLDVTQAQADANQAMIDGKQATLDFNEAAREANPPDMQKWADQLQMITPILSGLIGIVGLVTAAQWLWNIAMTANPIGVVIVAVAALIAIIVLIATKTNWFQRAWRASWGWIKDAAKNTWDFLKKIPGWIGTAFAVVAKAITAPFRLAFNFVADAWNNTIGRLSWSVPGWVPGIGGNTISVPNIPKFHSGGTVPGPPGSEMLAIVQAGEHITPAGAAGAGTVVVVVKLDRNTLIEGMAKGVRRRGGSVEFVLGGANA